MEAFELCLQHGCDGFEFDVRVTADGVGIVCHDPHFRGLEVMRSKAVDLAQCSTLATVVDAFVSRAFLNVELKVAGAENSVAEFAKRYEAKQIVVSSFLPNVLRTVHSISPALPLGLICAHNSDLAEWPNLPVDAVIVNYKLASRSLVDEFHAAGKEAWVWTVNKEKEMLGMIELGFDAIISDDTKLLGSVVLGDR
jgi:glycerophosphoryl diester phosphodiesterase